MLNQKRNKKTKQKHETKKTKQQSQRNQKTMNHIKCLLLGLSAMIGLPQQLPWKLLWVLLLARRG